LLWALRTLTSTSALEHCMAWLWRGRRLPSSRKSPVGVFRFQHCFFVRRSAAWYSSMSRLLVPKVRL
jgi:hypothetical protein